MKAVQYIDIPEAIYILQQHAPQPKAEHLMLHETLQRILLNNISSQIDYPPFDNSALDGYACREEDTLHASLEHPVTLNCIGEVAAGQIFPGKIDKGQAVGVYTGAAMPSGANAIVALEHTQATNNQVQLFEKARAKDIRFKASQLQKGTVYLHQGQVLSPHDIGLAATMGYATLPVAIKPKVGLLVTGNEICEPGRVLADGQIYNSNVYAIAALIRQAGAEVAILPNCRDHADDLKNTIRQHPVDLLITTGGVSVGRYDVVRDLILQEGQVFFWKVKIRPGMPVLFGQWQNQLILGLPGNPNACMVIFWILATAWIYKALGRTTPLPYEQRLRAKTQHSFRHGKDKTAFWRSCYYFDREKAHYIVKDAAHRSGFDHDCLVVTPPYQDIQANTWVDFIPV